MVYDFFTLRLEMGQIWFMFLWFWY